MFEPDDHYILVANIILFNSGLEILHTAQNEIESRKLISQVEEGKIRPDIAIVSAFVEKHHTDGEKIAKRLKEISPKIKIIAYTILEDQEWADYTAIKSGKKPEQTLILALKDLLGKKFDLGNKN